MISTVKANRDSTYEYARHKNVKVWNLLSCNIDNLRLEIVYDFSRCHSIV